jgi:hypothetical protein
MLPADLIPSVVIFPLIPPAQLRPGNKAATVSAPATSNPLRRFNIFSPPFL